jgi:hypothetical protein
MISLRYSQARYENIGVNRIHSLNKNPKLNSSSSHFNLFPLSSNIIQRRNYSTDRKITLNPLFVTGFSDAESSFVVTILKNPRYKIG